LGGKCKLKVIYKSRSELRVNVSGGISGEENSEEEEEEELSRKVLKPC